MLSVFCNFPFFSAGGTAFDSLGRKSQESRTDVFNPPVRSAALRPIGRAGTGLMCGYFLGLASQAIGHHRSAIGERGHVPILFGTAFVNGVGNQFLESRGFLGR